MNTIYWPNIVSNLAYNIGFRLATILCQYWVWNLALARANIGKRPAKSWFHAGTHVKPRSHRAFARVIPRLVTDRHTMYPQCFAHVSPVFCPCIPGVLPMYPRCFAHVSPVFCPCIPSFFCMLRSCPSYLLCKVKGKQEESKKAYIEIKTKLIK